MPMKDQCGIHEMLRLRQPVKRIRRIIETPLSGVQSPAELDTDLIQAVCPSDGKVRP